ncbi:hypothetical protein SBV1_60019 [Verrucomicrobia bacterium]|nr:hypothetical protein SBV1_60019 [Verrucomicrobiota bacterium]
MAKQSRWDRPPPGFSPYQEGGLSLVVPCLLPRVAQASKKDGVRPLGMLKERLDNCVTIRFNAIDEPI